MTREEVRSIHLHLIPVLASSVCKKSKRNVFLYQICYCTSECYISANNSSYFIIIGNIGMHEMSRYCFRIICISLRTFHIKRKV